MKRKEIEFEAEELVRSVEAFAAHTTGRRKLRLRTRAIRLPKPLRPVRPKVFLAA